MENELLLLEGKLEQLLGLVTRLRTENTDLSNQLATVQGENNNLRNTIGATKTKIEQLVASIPDEEDGTEEEDVDSGVNSV